MTDGIEFAHINARDFARVLPFRAVMDVRYYLNGVYVEPLEHGAIIVATAGHMMAALRSPDTYVAEPVIVDVTPAFASAVKRVGKGELAFIRAATKTSTLEVVNRVPIGARARAGEDVAFVKPGRPFIDGKYPEWKKIIPADDKLGRGLPGIYNGDYLHEAISAICEGPKVRRYGRMIQFYHQASDPETGAAIIRAGDDFVCLVMPVRDTKVSAMPTWLRATPTEPAPATEPEKAAA